MHEEKKCLCDTCDFIVTQIGILKRHKQSVHEGKKCPCDTCDFHATQKAILRRHKQSVHEGKKYHVTFLQHKKKS